MFGSKKKFSKVLYRKCRNTSTIYNNWKKTKLNYLTTNKLNEILHLEPLKTELSSIQNTPKVSPVSKLNSVKLFGNCGIVQHNKLITASLLNCKPLLLNDHLQKRTLLDCGRCAKPPPEKLYCEPDESGKKKIICPALVKREGLCFRIEMPCCKKSCRYHRKFCCNMQRPFDGSRQRTPKPAFSECMYIHVKTHPECQCNNGSSICNVRVFTRHPEPEGCKKPDF